MTDSTCESAALRLEIKTRKPGGKAALYKIAEAILFLYVEPEGDDVAVFDLVCLSLQAHRPL